MSLEKIFYKKKCRAWIILCLLVVFTVTGCRKPVNTESVSEAVTIPNKDNEEMTQARLELEEVRNIDMSMYGGFEQVALSVSLFQGMISR